MYAQIQNGIVINIILANSMDYFDPSFTWVNINALSPMPAIGWTYDGNVFTSNIPSLTLQQAQQTKLLAFQQTIQNFITLHYSLEIRFNFNALYILAVQQSLTNRAIYITQLFTWAEAIVAYSATYSATIMAMTDPNTVLASTWDLTQIPSDPAITPMAAIQILN